MSKKDGGVAETAQEVALAQVAKAKVADFRKRWYPLQKQNALQIDRSGAADSQTRRMAQGMATADTDVAFEGAERQALQRTAANNELGSSGSKLAMTSMGDDQATSMGLNRAQADINVDAQRLAGLNNVVALGQGREAKAVAGMVDLAADSAATARMDAAESLDRRAGNAQIIGTGLGLAAGAYRSAGVNQGDLNAANASNDPIGTLNTRKGWTR